MIKYICLMLLLSVPVYAGAMQSDTAHKIKEEHMANLAYGEMLKLKHSEAVRWLITPKLRLSKEDIQSLQKGSLLNVDGQRTSATLTFIEGDIASFTNGPDLVMETVNYDVKKNAYVVSYGYPKDVPNYEKRLKVQLSDIKVKEAEDDIGKYIVNLVAHPYTATQSVAPQPSVPQAVYPAQPTPQTVIVSPAPPRTETVIIERGPYYGPGYYGPGVVIGGVWGPHRYGHRHW